VRIPGADGNVLEGHGDVCGPGQFVGWPAGNQNEATAPTGERAEGNGPEEVLRPVGLHLGRRRPVRIHGVLAHDLGRGSTSTAFTTSTTPYGGIIRKSFRTANRCG
jgi:hypothetical protein